jgi:uncharacterized Zn finger protein (UPF0148 family)
MADYQVKRARLTGKKSLRYSCPACGAPLRSPYSAAGTQDTCPECQRVFTVPGAEEIEADATANAFEEFAREEIKGAATSKHNSPTLVKRASWWWWAGSLSGFGAGVAVGLLLAPLTDRHVNEQLRELRNDLDVLEDRMVGVGRQATDPAPNPDRSPRPESSKALRPSSQQVTKLLEKIVADRRAAMEMAKDLGVTPSGEEATADQLLQLLNQLNSPASILDPQDGASP